MSKHTNQTRGKAHRKARKRLSARRSAFDDTVTKMSPLKQRGVRRPGSMKQRRN